MRAPVIEDNYWRYARARLVTARFGLARNCSEGICKRTVVKVFTLVPTGWYVIGALIGSESLEKVALSSEPTTLFHSLIQLKILFYYY